MPKALICGAGKVEGHVHDSTDPHDSFCRIKPKIITKDKLSMIYSEKGTRQD